MNRIDRIRDRIDILKVGDAAEYIEHMMLWNQHLRSVAHYEALYRQLLLVREAYARPLPDQDVKIDFLLLRAIDRLTRLVAWDRGTDLYRFGK